MQGCKYITDLKITLMISESEGNWGFKKWTIYAMDAPSLPGLGTVQGKDGTKSELHKYPINTYNSEEAAKLALSLLLKTTDKLNWHVPVISTGQYIYLEIKPTALLLQNIYKKLGFEL